MNKLRLNKYNSPIGIRKNPMRERIILQSAITSALYRMFPYFKPKESERILNPDE